MTNQTKLYDLTVLLTDEEVSSIEALLHRAGAENLERKELTKLQLAYPIKKRATAFMGVYAFTLAPDAVKELLKGLKFDEHCLRHLLLIRKRNAEGEQAPGESQAPKAPPLKVSFRNGRRGAPVERRKPSEAEPLTNEALQKKIEEISN